MGGLFAALWAFLTADIRSLKQNSVTRNEFEAHRADVKQIMDSATVQRKELREGIIDLYKAQKELTSTVHNLHIDVLKAMKNGSADS